MDRARSESVFSRSCRVIPGGVNSPVRSFPGLSQVPLVVERGYRDRVIDVDGHSYIDYCGSWGALIHGHAHPQIIDAVAKRLAKGSSFGITTEIEAELAELITGKIPHIEKLRFVSSGTEATMSAIRLARGYTGRNLVVKFAGNYHGHADLFLVQAGSGLISFTPLSSSAGVPQESVKNTLSLPYNDFESLKKTFSMYGEKIAALIVEPVAANMGVVPPQPGFLELLREECHRSGTLLIFDEVISGFRLSFGGAAQYYHIKPDLCCFGKIVGGGFPAAAFGGRGDIMDLLAPLGPVYQAGTLSGSPVAMEAGYQALTLCQEENFYKNLKSKTDLLCEPIREIIQKRNLNIALQQVESMFTLFFGRRSVNNFEEAKRCDTKHFNQCFKTLFLKGIYLAPSQFEANFISSTHSEEALIYTRDCILDAILTG